MRFIEIITESEEEQLLGDINDLLVAAKASGIDEIDTEEFVQQLVDMGHSVTPNSLLTLFDEDRPEVIKNITANTIQLTLQDSGDAEQDYEQHQKDVERDTNKLALKNIKDRAQRNKQLAKGL